ncbi:MAG: NADP-dependent oxidoreductase [Candidatus Limnocylindrales bacterium]
MRAFALDSFGEAGAIRDLPEPSPGDGEVLVEIRSAGMTATDLAVMAGFMSAYGIPHVFPLIPGIDASGVIVSMGDGVEGFAVGDEVYGYSSRQSFGQGTFAELASIPVVGLAHKPSAFGFAEVSVIGHGSLTALAAIEAAHVMSGETVVLLGATGGVGSYALQMLRSRGADVIAITLAQYEGYARSLGANEVVDYNTTDPVAATRQLRPNGVKSLIDLAGIPELFTGMSELVESGGRVISVVLPPDAEGLAGRGVEGMMATRFAADGRLPEIAAQIESRQLKLPAIQIFDFDDIADAVALQATRHVHGKLTLRIP